MCGGLTCISGCAFNCCASLHSRAAIPARAVFGHVARSRRMRRQPRSLLEYRCAACPGCLQGPSTRALRHVLQHPTPSQGLNTSSVDIAAAALRKRESLARDVERELQECLATCSAAAAQEDAGGDMGLGACAWGMGGDDDAMSGCEDDVFACEDEPCNVHAPASTFAPCFNCLHCL